MLADFIVNLYKIGSIIPFLPFFVTWLIAYFFMKNKKKAMFLAMDVTTAFLIVSVAVLFNTSFSSGFGLYGILLFLLLTAGFIGNAQNRMKGKVNLPKLSRALWRMSFFVLSFFYVVFLFIGIGQRLLAV